MKNEKILVQIKDVPYIYLEFDLFEGELKEVSNKILNIRKLLIDAWKNRELTIKDSFRKDMIPIFTHYKDYEKIEIVIEFGYDSEGDIGLKIWRKETDEEFNKRIELSKIISENAKKSVITKKLAQEKREKTLLENLKKKYENS